MSFIKVKKNNSYHSRFQVKWRRRREGKTDYYSRKRLICQDKRKFQHQKFRLVVRISKKFIKCQYVCSFLYGDEIDESINSRNFTQRMRFYTDINRSLKNFPIAYLTGAELAGKYKLKDKNSKPISAILDIGLTRSTIGQKVFAVMQGAVDCGIYIPHSEKKFPAYNPKDGFSKEILEERVSGKHIYDYRCLLAEGDEEAFNKQFNPKNNQ